MSKISLFLSLLTRSLLDVILPFNLGRIIEETKNTKTIDERLARLGAIKHDLESAIEAVETLQEDASKRKAEVQYLQQTLLKLNEDKVTAEALLKIPEESFSRILARAAARSRVIGLIQGIIIGLCTGILSSLFVWWLTTRN
jgi:hypothetical protein